LRAREVRGKVSSKRKCSDAVDLGDDSPRKEREARVLELANERACEREEARATKTKGIKKGRGAGKYGRFGGLRITI